MQRRDFHKRAVSAAVLTLFGVAGCGGGGGGGGPAGGAPAGSASGPRPGGDPAPAADEQAAAVLVATLGTNLSGMEWAGGVRTSSNTAPNLHFTVPRAAEIRWLAANGFGKNRLPVMWELLQPVLADTRANAQVRSLVGEPGAFHEGHASFVQSVLDAHAAVGSRCILDLHNYCRYRDFRYQADGSVIGLTRPADPTLHAYTTDASQVVERIMATAPGATLRPAAFADFWRRVAQRWGTHPGFGGYGLMNEPHDMPRPGQVVESVNGGEDLSIWPVFARAAIDAIRAVDPAGPVYVSGNAWGGAMNIGAEFNPQWPLAGSNLVYEVHSYLDAFNNGGGFDWDLEVAKNYVAGFGVGAMTADTGRARMQIATDWARANGTRVALTETGMPIDDARWSEAFRRLVEHTWQNGWELQTWMGGSHWAARNHAINHAPGWHQDRTLEPLVAGPLKAAAGIDRAALFDDGPAWAQGGEGVTVTVYARGHLASPVTLQVASDNGGTFDKATLVIPAGSNGQDSFRFVPAQDRVTTLRYSPAVAGRQVPPPRRVYSLADPVAAAATDLQAAALAILARYRASKWDMADGYTDYVLGRPAQDGERVRAVADSGFGSSNGNAMEMLNWMNQDIEGMGPLQPGVMRTQGRKGLDLSAAGATGLWCHKVLPGPTFPNPRNVLPFGLRDPHFVLAVVVLPSAASAGTVFQALVNGQPWHAELAVAAGRAEARWRDVDGQQVVLAGPPLPVGTPVVLAMTSRAGRQELRVDSAGVGTGSASFGAGPLADLMIGSGGFRADTVPSFRGAVHAVVAGPGTPSSAELSVLERYLTTRA